MNKLLYFLVLFFILSCDSEGDRNRNLPNVPVSETVFLNLHNELQHPSGSTTISGGIAGIIIYNVDNTRFMAWDAACPHLAPSECTAMTVQNLFMICSCDESKFSILDGSPQSNTEFAARQYRVVKEGNTLFVSNF